MFSVYIIEFISSTDKAYVMGFSLLASAYLCPFENFDVICKYRYLQDN